jgi:phosphate transport system ATP-binding protein
VGDGIPKSNPFPKSIFDNVAYGLRVNGITDKNTIREAVEESLTRAFLWEEVKDKLTTALICSPAVSNNVYA